MSVNDLNGDSDPLMYNGGGNIRGDLMTMEHCLTLRELIFLNFIIIIFFKIK